MKQYTRKLQVGGPFYSDRPSVRDLRNDSMNRKIVAHNGKPLPTNSKQAATTYVQRPKQGKVATDQERRARAEAENKAAEQSSQLEARKAQVQESMEKTVRHPLWNLPGTIAPGGIAILSMEAGLKSAENLQEGNYKGAAINAGIAALPAVGKLASIIKSSAKVGGGIEGEISFLEKHIGEMGKQKEALENVRKGFYAEYKAGNITAAEYGSKAQALDVPGLDIQLGVKQKELRHAFVRKDIAGARQQNIMQSEEQLGRNISDGGSNSLGVFELGDNHVARLSKYGHDDASRLVNYAERIKSPRTAKTLQVKEIDGKVYQVQEKASGTPITKMSETELRDVPQEHVDNFWKDKAELDELGLSIDVSGEKSNIFYDRNKGFQFIDLGISESPSSSTITEVYKGLKSPTPARSVPQNQLSAYQKPVVDTPLPKEMEPYISRYEKPISREQEVFENSFPAEQRNKFIDDRTVHLDSKGNVIPDPRIPYTAFTKKRAGGILYKSK